VRAIYEQELIGCEDSKSMEREMCEHSKSKAGAGCKYIKHMEIVGCMAQYKHGTNRVRSH